MYEILRALQPFFEIVAVSNMPNFELEQIINHIESVLNKPIAEMIVKQKNLREELIEAQRNSNHDEESKQLIA